METTGIKRVYIGYNGKENGNYRDYIGFRG